MVIDSELFTFPFTDEDWIKKLATGILVVLGAILIVPAFGLVGYGLRIMQITIREGKPRLPTWENFGELIVLGLKYTVVTLVYMLPIYIMMLPYFIIVINAAMTNSDPTGIMIGAQLVTMACMMPVSFLLAYLITIATAHMVAHDGQLAAAFEFKAVWQMAWKNLKYFGIAFLLYYAISYVLMVPYMILFFTIILIPVAIGVFSVLSQAYFGAFFGLAYRNAFPPEGEPIAG